MSVDYVLKTESKVTRVKNILAELDNAIFPSKEDDGVEHIDMSYKDFIHKIAEIASIAVDDTSVHASVTLSGGRINQG